MKKILNSTRPCFFGILLLAISIFGTDTLLAQGNKDKKAPPKNQAKSSEYVGKSQAKPKTYQGTGRDLVTKVKKRENKDAKGTGRVLTTKTRIRKTKQDLGDDASMRASFRGNTNLVDNSGRRFQNQRNTSSYSGNVSLKNIRSAGKTTKKNSKNIASYQGNIRYKDPARQREATAGKLSKFKGADPIRVRKSPRGAIVAVKNTTNANRNSAIYSRAKLGKGRHMDKKYLANYQKEKPKKLKVDKREVKMWNEGGVILSKRPSRDLPKNNKRANKKAAKKNSTRDPGGEEEDTYDEIDE